MPAAGSSNTFKRSLQLFALLLRLCGIFHNVVLLFVDLQIVICVDNASGHEDVASQSNHERDRPHGLPDLKKLHNCHESLSTIIAC